MKAGQAKKSKTPEILETFVTIHKPAPKNSRPSERIRFFIKGRAETAATADRENSDKELVSAGAK